MSACESSGPAPLSPYSHPPILPIDRTLSFFPAYFGDEVSVEPGLELAEYKLLCRAVQDACRELRFDAPQCGRDCLLAGLARASDYAEAGVPWGDGLADEYRRALREYDQLVESYLVPTWFRTIHTR